MSHSQKEQADHGHAAAGGAAHDGGHGHGGENVYPYTPHHFHEAKQHFESGKQGVWLFLVTEILFFAGLFCAYTIYRAQNPEVFYWSHFYLDTKLGAANTVVLILSSFTAAWAVRNAQLGQNKLLRMNIILTICGALFFMGVKTIEYRHKFHDGLLPARHFQPKHEVWETETFAHKHPGAAKAAKRISAELLARKNKTAVLDTVVPAGERAMLVPVNQAGNQLAAQPTASAPAQAPSPASGQPMAAAKAGTVTATAGQPGGGKPTTGEPNGSETAAPQPAVGDANPGDPNGAERTIAQAVEGALGAPLQALPDDIWLAEQIRRLSPADRHPLEMAGVIRQPAGGPPTFARPEKAGIFFSIYFFMTGLHGLHVVIGIGIWIWMLAIAARRKFGPKYFGPIEFSALYWHLVDLIWIYLFPMLYLIH